MKADNSTFGRFKAGATDIVIDDVAAIAKEAGDAIMAIYNGTSEADWKKIADFKADGSPLTKADTTANKIICDALRKKYPKGLEQAWDDLDQNQDGMLQFREFVAACRKIQFHGNLRQVLL